MRVRQELSDLPLQSCDLNRNNRCKDMPKQRQKDDYRPAKSPSPSQLPKNSPIIQSIYQMQSIPKPKTDSQYLRNLIKKKLTQGKAEKKKQVKQIASTKNPTPKLSKYQQILDQFYGGPRGASQSKRQCSNHLSRCQSVKKDGSRGEGGKLQRYRSEKVIQVIEKVPGSYLQGYRRKIRG